MHDFRRLPGEVAGIVSRELRFAIRRAFERRDVALQLYEATNGPVPPFALTIGLDDDPEDVAAAFRDQLGVQVEEQFSWRGKYEPLNHWRAAFEGLGILVSQMQNVETAECRGFSISERPLPTIVLNIRDAPSARCFTLFHELAHLGLTQGGLCDMNGREARAPQDLRVEIFCNAVAGAALVPAEILLYQPEVIAGKGPSWTDQETSALATRFGVSREVVLRRLLTLGRTTETFYQQKRHQYLAEYRHEQESVQGGPVPQHRLVLALAGPLFVRTVLSNYYQNNLTASDVSELLGLRLKHLPKLESELFQRQLEAAA